MIISFILICLFYLILIQISPLTVSRFLDTMPPALRHNFICDLSLAESAVQGGHIANTRTTTLYKHWASHCSDLQVDHRLRDPHLPRIELLQVFGHRVRNGYYSKQSGVRADSVASAWRAIAEVHLLEGLPDPRKPPGSSSKDLDKRLSRILRHYAYQDPPPVQARKICPARLGHKHWGIFRVRRQIPMYYGLDPDRTLLLPQILRIHQDPISPPYHAVPPMIRAIPRAFWRDTGGCPTSKLSQGPGRHALSRHTEKLRQGRVHLHGGFRPR